MNPFVQRRQRLGRALKAEHLDALLITKTVNVTYLTGFTGDSSYLILTPKKTLLISDFRYAQQIEEECPGLETIIRPSTQPVQAASAEALTRLRCRAVGFESSSVSVADHEKLRELAPTVEWKGAADRVEQLRIIKDAGEIAAIRTAIGAAERAFDMFRAMLRPTDNEKELADALEGYVRRAGGRRTSFAPIVAVGPRAALAHATPGSQRVDEAGLLLVDWGAETALYKSDLTRVLATRRISPKLEKVYAVVSRAQEKAIRAVRPGAEAKKVDAEARGHIQDEGFGKYFDHGLGHGIGLEIHEAPSVRASSEDRLQPGMVLTIEPGIYIPGWGGVRLEDDVLVTEDGCEVLSQVSKELTCVFD
ncbi:MAG: M24 family metallopeptidase [Gemmataceae bacterium]